MVFSMNTRAVPIILAALCIIPLGGTLYRLAEIITTGVWRFNFNPELVDRLPLFLHGIGMALFLVLGALQFSPKLRVKRPNLHRTLGRTAGVGALLGGVTGIWMTLAHLEISTPLLIAGRLLFGSAMIGFTVLAIRCAMNRDFITHREWIIRAYAIAMAAGTLPFVFFPVFLIFGDPSPILDDVIQIAGWMINFAIAEVIIKRTRHKPTPALKGATA